MGATATQTVEAMRRTVSFHGIPHKLVTDSGPQFFEHEIEEFIRAIDIRHQRTPPYNSASNGQVEKLVQELIKSFKTKPKDTSRDVNEERAEDKVDTLSPGVEGKVRDTQYNQYQQASVVTRSLNPVQTVSILNPRTYGRGKWLHGLILQRLRQVNYLVEVDGQPRYVHIEHLRVRDIRSISIPVAESTSTDAVEVNIPDMEIPLSIAEQTSKSLEVPLQYC
ncbi:uncharacterized protein LOC134187104 [Corticium candelabrum]|uniref:uncharacterized protein LOC134187104 n=1 Tax=Corticium candelabrum TaxID=121492 RepID=UPI002E26EE4E|nr:uncharacterized protein LOC134187104 [Corticium candelabrum]